jgi:integrase
VSSAFRRYVGRHDLKPIRMHGLRHTFATSSLAAGVPLEVISKMLGHARIEITANTYAHATPELFTDAVNRLDAYYRLA